MAGKLTGKQFGVSSHAELTSHAKGPAPAELGTMSPMPGVAAEYKHMASGTETTGPRSPLIPTRAAPTEAAGPDSDLEPEEI